jgi:hypothetical protein
LPVALSSGHATPERKRAVCGPWKSTKGPNSTHVQYCAPYPSFAERLIAAMAIAQPCAMSREIAKTQDRFVKRLDQYKGLERWSGGCGVGYLLCICSNPAELPQHGAQIKYIAHITCVRMPCRFLGSRARGATVFDLLMQVSGIGPKLALTSFG